MIQFIIGKQNILFGGVSRLYQCPRSTHLWQKTQIEGGLVLYSDGPQKNTQFIRIFNLNTFEITYEMELWKDLSTSNAPKFIGFVLPQVDSLVFGFSFANAEDASNIQRAISEHAIRIHSNTGQLNQSVPQQRVDQNDSPTYVQRVIENQKNKVEIQYKPKALRTINEKELKINFWGVQKPNCQSKLIDVGRISNIQLNEELNEQILNIQSEIEVTQVVSEQKEVSFKSQAQEQSDQSQIKALIQKDTIISQEEQQRMRDSSTIQMKSSQVKSNLAASMILNSRMPQTSMVDLISKNQQNIRLNIPPPPPPPPPPLAPHLLQAPSYSPSIGSNSSRQVIKSQAEKGTFLDEIRAGILLKHVDPLKSQPQQVIQEDNRDELTQMLARAIEERRRQMHKHSAAQSDDSMDSDY